MSPPRHPARLRPQSIRGLWAGPIALVAMFAIRSVRPVVDPTLTGIGVLFVAATIGTMLANRIAAGLLAFLAAAMFQPIVARDLSFSLGGIDSDLWRAWAFVTVIATGWTLICAVVVLVGRPVTTRSGIAATALGAGIGVALLFVFPILSEQPVYGADLDADRHPDETLTIICTIGDHLDQGMTATLDVRT